jgi:hypothetical protein
MRDAIAGLAVAALFLSEAATTGQAADCPRTLAALDAKLPNYDVAELQRIRGIILATDTRKAMKDQLATYRTPEAVATATRKEANALEADAPQAEGCVRRIGPKSTEILESLRAGTYRFHGGTKDVSEACASSYVRYYYNAVASRALADAMACIAAR